MRHRLGGSAFRAAPNVWPADAEGAGCAEVPLRLPAQAERPVEVCREVSVPEADGPNDHSVGVLVRKHRRAHVLCAGRESRGKSSLV